MLTETDSRSSTVLLSWKYLTVGVPLPTWTSVRNPPSYESTTLSFQPSSLYPPPLLRVPPTTTLCLRHWRVRESNMQTHNVVMQKNEKRESWSKTKPELSKIRSSSDIITTNGIWKRQCGSYCGVLCENLLVNNRKTYAFVVKIQSQLHVSA